ncbi:hypothetical protein NA29_25745 [Pandoraea sputorum]|nr:hypothetical protein NA29_25745 [Pandoraea sputorum]
MSAYSDSIFSQSAATFLFSKLSLQVYARKWAGHNGRSPQGSTDVRPPLGLPDVAFQYHLLGV